MSSISNKAFKKGTKDHIYDCLTFPKLMTTPLITTCVEVLVAKKRKDFLKYLPLIKSGLNTKNPNKFYIFYHDHRHDTEKCHPLTKKLERLISKGCLQEFIKDEIQYDQIRKTSYNTHLI